MCVWGYVFVCVLILFFESRPRSRRRRRRPRRRRSVSYLGEKLFSLRLRHASLARAGI
jgi:hypothetical protein